MTNDTEKSRRILRTIAALILFAGSSLAGLTAEGATSSEKSGAAAQERLDVPNGTVLPVRVEHQLSSRGARNGQVITLRLMQDVPLPAGGKIREGAKVYGAVVEVAGGREPAGARMRLRFDEIESHGQKWTIVTDLRAIASALEVASAQTPESSIGFGTPYVWATTRLVGGGEKYGVGGPVTDEWSNPVGEGTPSGVLVHISAREGSGCRGDVDGANRLQALWVFSADACGVYGSEELKILHAGRDEPIGEIILGSDKGEVKIRSGSGMLLRVIK